MRTDVSALEHVVQVAKQWTLARFGLARTADFALSPHRFELWDRTVRRRAVPPQSPEGRSPLDVVLRSERPTAWAHSAVLTVLFDSDGGTVGYEQEVVEILAMDDTELSAEFAYVIRTPGFPPCLGPFQS
jgi:hypothetical protein